RGEQHARDGDELGLEREQPGHEGAGALSRQRQAVLPGAEGRRARRPGDQDAPESAVTERIIRPEDVSAVDAKTILDFLNSAETAQQIADRIELPNEPDVGPRLAAAILQHRTQLEGFRSLADLDAVKGIGPVRFTRIVESLVGTAQPVDSKAFDALVAQVAALQSRLDALRLQASVGGAGLRIELRAVEPQRYLGQPTTLIATVTGAD